MTDTSPVSETANEVPRLWAIEGSGVEEASGPMTPATGLPPPIDMVVQDAIRSPAHTNHEPFGDQWISVARVPSPPWSGMVRTTPLVRSTTRIPLGIGRSPAR